MSPPSPVPAAVASADGTTIAFDVLGAGAGLILLGGALRAGRDYLELAQMLATSHTVYLVDRRGRGRSGAQGGRYSIDREVEDLLAVQAETGARILFGHSYGGLVGLEAARRGTQFADVVAYEPGVSVGGSIPSGWTGRYRELLAAGDARGAFTAMARGSGFAPAALRRMPEPLARIVLRAAVRGEEWRRMEPLLPASAAEHEQLAAIDDGTVARFATISARVLLLGGGRSPSFITADPFAQLCAVIPDVEAAVIPGLDHTGPERRPHLVAARIQQHLRRGDAAA